MKNSLNSISSLNFNDDFVLSLTEGEIYELKVKLANKRKEVDTLVIDGEFVGNSYNNLEALENKCNKILKK